MLDDVMDEEGAVAAAVAAETGQAEAATGTMKAEKALATDAHYREISVPTHPELAAPLPPTETAPPPQADAELSILQSGAVRTLDGDIAGDERAADAINYQILLGKIDSLLDVLKLDA